VIEQLRLLMRWNGRNYHIEARFTTSYHPQTNGRVERLNQIIGRMLSKFCAGDVNRWDYFVDSVCFNLNIRRHTVTGKSPCYLMYGFTPRLPGNVIPPGLYDLQEVTDRRSYQARELEILGQSRAAAFHRSQQQATQMSKRHDESHTIKSNAFKVGDLVRRKMGRTL